MKIRDIINEDGRIVKGVNTTVDVGTDEIKRQASKFGNKVDKDGRPPTLSKKVKGKSTNVLFNLGLAESYTRDQLPQIKNKQLSKIKHTLETVRLTDLIPVQKERIVENFKRQVDNIVAGNYKPIIVDSKNRIVNGHHRYTALEMLGYKSVEVARLPWTLEQILENFTEGYKLQLERDREMLVLNITDTSTGKRTEVRGNPGYETEYDANDKLHQLLDKVGKSANISDLMNGEVVGINPNHPDADRAKAATDRAYSENFADGKKKGKSRPGRVKKSGASCNGSVTALRKRAKNASGEKAKMYHWCANMKSGRKKK